MSLSGTSNELGTTASSVGATTKPPPGEEMALWRLKKQLREIENFRGHQSSLISLFITSTTPLARVGTLLTEELGASACIKTTKTRQNVQEALRCIQSHVKMMRRVPDNGIVIYCGLYSEGDKDKRVKYEVEPPKPISSFRYLCDSHFETAPLHAMLQDAPAFGYVVVYALAASCSGLILF
jgi:peptide chain release factor subunit 1